MLFTLPAELLSLVFEYLSPDCILALQVLTRRDLLSLYRHAVGYINAENERAAFELFREKYFMRFLYNHSMRVPRDMTQNLLGFKVATPPLLNMVNCRGVSGDGKLVMAVFQQTSIERQSCSWPVFKSIASIAQKGEIAQLADLDEETELALVLVQNSKWSSVNTLLRNYLPHTVQMIKAMLHFGVDFDMDELDKNLLDNQDLCEFWFFRRPCPSQEWLVNNLPDTITVDRMLEVNAGRFLMLATKKTLIRYGIIRDRLDWTRQSRTFFPALLRLRKKCSLKMKDLISLSDLHIRLHGRIDHLLVTNRVLLRSRLFRPPMIILEMGASHHDELFALFLDRIPFLTLTERDRLRTLVEPSFARPSLPLPSYIFTDEKRVELLSRAQLLETAFAGNVVLETVL